MSYHNEKTTFEKHCCILAKIFVYFAMIGMCCTLVFFLLSEPDFSKTVAASSGISLFCAAVMAIIGNVRTASM